MSDEQILEAAGLKLSINYKRKTTQSDKQKEDISDEPFDEIAPSDKAKSLLTDVSFYTDRGLEKREVEVNSLETIQLVRATLETYLQHETSTPWTTATDRPVLSVNDTTVLHHWEELCELVSDPKQVSDLAHMGVQKLIDWFKRESPLAGKLTSIKETKRVSFAEAHLLFKPGSVIVARSFLTHRQLFQVERHNLYERSTSKKGLLISAIAYDWDGTELVRKKYEFDIKKYEDDKPLLDLDCYPLWCDDDPAELRRTLEERGRKFLGYCKQHPSGGIIGYQGRVVVEKKGTNLLGEVGMEVFERLIEERLIPYTESETVSIKAS
jgi:hypothetical protein